MNYFTRMMNFQMFGAATHIIVLCLLIVFAGFERAMYLYGIYHLIMQVIGGVIAVNIYNSMKRGGVL